MTNSMPAIETEPSSWVNRSLLIAEDDKPFLQRLARAMEIRGFEVVIAESVADGFLNVEQGAPAFAVVGMRLNDGNGLEVKRSDLHANMDRTAMPNERPMRGDELPERGVMS